MEDVRPLTTSMRPNSHKEPVSREEPCSLSLAAVAALLQEKGYLVAPPQQDVDPSHSWEARRGWSR